LWNVSSFASKLLEDYHPVKASAIELQPLDKWILSKAENLTKKVTDAFEKCQFNIAVENIRNFTWHVFCDAYVEAVKDRLYRPEVHGQAAKTAAQYTLYEVLYRMLQLLAPIMPHMTEEIYQTMYANGKGHKSLQISPWPEFNKALVDEEAEKRGELVVAVIGEVRREKAENHLPLNLPIDKLTIYTGSQLNSPESQFYANTITHSKNDIAGTLKVVGGNFDVRQEEGSGRQIPEFPGVIPVAEYSKVLKK
jgi:valyl-tRNA synthetase